MSILIISKNEENNYNLFKELLRSPNPKNLKITLWWNNVHNHMCMTKYINHALIFCIKLKEGTATSVAVHANA